MKTQKSPKVPLGDEIDWKRFKLRREQLGLTQFELAVKSGVTQRVISQIERGARPHTWVRTALQLARAMECSLDFLVGIRDSPDLPRRARH